MKTSLCKQFSRQHANSSSRARQALSPDLASHERQSAIRCNTLCSHSAGLIGPPRAWSPWIALENLTFEPEKSRSTSWAWMLTEWWWQEDFVSPSSQRNCPRKWKNLRKLWGVAMSAFLGIIRAHFASPGENVDWCRQWRCHQAPQFPRVVFFSILHARDMDELG